VENQQPRELRLGEFAMSTAITLLVTDGNVDRKSFTFDEPTTCLIGRAPDCDVQLPADQGHIDVSRHHCLLEINPPRAFLRDLNSLNGTFVNSRQIDETELKHGDEIFVGRVAFRVCVEVWHGTLVPLSFL
jgi:pSer/pThr/pTyr-binding forkhead associated (FHA) protein